MEARDIISTLGAIRIADRLGVNRAQVYRARQENIMPASWFIAVAEMSRNEGIDCPRAAFKFKGVAK